MGAASARLQRQLRKCVSSVNVARRSERAERTERVSTDEHAVLRGVVHERVGARETELVARG